MSDFSNGLQNPKRDALLSNAPLRTVGFPRSFEIRRSFAGLSEETKRLNRCRAATPCLSKDRWGVPDIPGQSPFVSVRFADSIDAGFVGSRTQGCSTASTNSVRPRESDMVGSRNIQARISGDHLLDLSVILPHKPTTARIGYLKHNAQRPHIVVQIRSTGARARALPRRREFGGPSRHTWGTRGHAGLLVPQRFPKPDYSTWPNSTKAGPRWGP